MGHYIGCGYGVIVVPAEHEEAVSENVADRAFIWGVDTYSHLFQVL